MAETKLVKIFDRRFDPREVTISVGDTVKWTNEGEERHTATHDNEDDEPQIFNSRRIEPGGEFEFTFSEPSGDSGIPYYCTIHGRRMSGKVIVQPVA